MEGATATASGRSAIAWYVELVGRFQETVMGNVPSNSTVLVVSRGDDELLRLGSREGWHFPRHPDGRYAGFHPKDSAAAIAHLEELHERGAQYIVFPESARWWLDYYEGFADHLNSRYSLVLDDAATCVIYELRLQEYGSSAETPTPVSTVPTAEFQVSPHLDDYVGTLLPDGPVAVLRAIGSRIQLAGREVVTFPSLDFKGDTRSALDELDSLGRRGVHYLVVPNASPSWLEEHPGFMAELERRYRLVAAQRHVCTVFELEQPAAATAAATAEEPPGGGVFERLKSWLGGGG